MAKAGRVHRRQRNRCAVLSRLPRAAPHQSAQHQPARTAQQGSQTPRRRRRHLPQRGRDHPADRRGVARAKRRMAAATPLYAGRGDGGTGRGGRGNRSPADPMRRLTRFKRSTVASKAWMPKLRSQCRCQAPQPRSGAPKAQGLIAALRPQHNPPCRRSRPCRRRPPFPLAPPPVMATQLYSRISTSLTDMTLWRQAMRFDDALGGAWLLAIAGGVLALAIVFAWVLLQRRRRSGKLELSSEALAPEPDARATGRTLNARDL